MSSDYDQQKYGGDQPSSDEPQGGSGQEAAFYALVGRALVDPAFRDQLRGGDPTAALKSLGIEPTREMVDAMGQAMGEVDRLSKHFGDVQAAT